MAIKFENLADRASKAKTRIEAWWMAHGDDVLNTAGRAVVSGVLGYGLGSLYVDVTGLRAARNTVDRQREYLIGVEDGQRMLVDALKHSRTDSVQQTN